MTSVESRALFVRLNSLNFIEKGRSPRCLVFAVICKQPLYRVSASNYQAISFIRLHLKLLWPAHHFQLNEAFSQATLNCDRSVNSIQLSDKPCVRALVQLKSFATRPDQNLYYLPSARVEPMHTSSVLGFVQPVAGTSASG